MNQDAPYSLVLTCHDSTPCAGLRSLRGRLCVTSQRALEFGFRLEGDIARLRIAPEAEPRRAERLWEHTCFEAFIAVRGEARYCEFNFSPSGEWAAYSFERYREGRPLEQDAAPGIAVRRSCDSIELHALVRAECLPSPAARHGAVLQVALSAVVEEQCGRLSYWALRHPPGRPDFHARDAFALEIEAPQDTRTDPGGSV